MKLVSKNLSEFKNINQLINQINKAVKHFSCFTNVSDSTLNSELKLWFMKWKRLITSEGTFFIICYAFVYINYMSYKLYPYIP